MKFTLNWLKEYIDIDMPIDELVELLDMSGTAVEGTTYLGKGFEKVVIGRVLKVEKHPNADKLSLCQVDIGHKELTIICGAPNVKGGQKVLVAKTGAELPNGVKITKAKIRGIKSMGMICSETELSLGDDASGIMVLPEDAPVGKDSVEYLGLDDYQIELEITPNRPDCLGVIGIARELGAITGKALKIPEIKLDEVSEQASSLAKISIEDPDLCPRYVGRVIRGVKIGPSPEWMQARLRNSGIRPINNIVDATNYVMMESSQPLHAFDLDRLGGSSIIVRRAKEGESIITLDDIERQLSSKNLMICDSMKPVAIAGVMGGEDSEVSIETVNVLIESAHFKPESVMSTSRTLGLITEASYRFEKGIDPNGCDWAASRAAQLMVEMAGGENMAGLIDVYPGKKESGKISFRHEKCNRFLGTNISAEKQLEIIENLGMKTKSDEKDTMILVIPSYRPDLEREVDVFEEIARIYGYSKIESTLPAGRKRKGCLTKYQTVKNKIRQLLVGSGLSEAINYSFLKEGWEDLLFLDRDSKLRDTIKLANPLAEDQAELRTTLLPGLLNVAKYNLNRDINNVQVFEFGRVFINKDMSLPEEREIIAGLLTGEWINKSWYGNYPEIDFFDAKGVIETIFRNLNIVDYMFQNILDGGRWKVEGEAQSSVIRHPSSFISYEFFHPGISALITSGDKTIGIVGEIHPKILQSLQIEQKVIYFELYLEEIKVSIAEDKIFQPVPAYPGIYNDIAIVVDEHYTSLEIQQEIIKSKPDYLKDINLFDVYQGEQISQGKKSLAFRLFFQSDEKTLQEEDILKIRDEIIDMLNDKTGASIRS